MRTLTTKRLTHVDDKGNAKMVDISDKEITKRTATAQGIIYLGPVISQLVESNNLKKGDAISVAKLAGIMAAKKTSELIPLCHNITLNDVQVDATVQGTSIRKHSFSYLHYNIF